MSNITVNKISTDVVENYTEQDLKLIPSFDIASEFDSQTDVVEFSVYNEQNIIEYINYNYDEYSITQVGSISIDPSQDLIKQGFTQGNYTTVYNFIRNRISSSLENPFYIKEISSDRTEIRIANNNISNEELETLVSDFKTELQNSPYFEDFEVNFGNNNIYLANNILTDISTPSQYTVLVKLYEPLETQFGVKDTLRVISQTAEEISYNVNFPTAVLPSPPLKQLKGPNFNLPKKGEVNNSTNFSDYDSLFNFAGSGAFTGSLGELKGLLANKGITPNVDYTDFNDFIYFSSAEERVRNFYYKIGLIEDYSASISELEDLTNADNSGSIADYQTKIFSIIENFDEYEQYQYYSSGSSDIYPKTNDEKPYTLALTSSAAAEAWLEDQVSSGSTYDFENVDRLFNSLPSYVQDDNRNAEFFKFMDMVGQHFDNVWVYTKDLGNRFDADNRLKYGISKDIVADAIRSMGVNLYQNNFSSANLLSSLTGVDSEGNLIPNFPYPAAEGDEYVSSYITASSEPTVVDDVNKEFYKRIFHNLPLLLKQKGSIVGLRNLINTFGVPDTTLRISEFGGKDKDNSDDWDYYQNVFNYGLTGTDVNLSNTALNSKFGTLSNVSFRFKYISGALPGDGDTLLLGSIGSNNVEVEYTGGGFISASYSGSIPSSSVYEGVIALGGAEITASFFNGEWWNIGVESSELKVGTKIYNGDDGFNTGFTASEAISITLGNGASLNGSDSKFAFQELRLYSNALTDAQFNDFVMNPLSIEGNSFEDSRNQLAFRAPLGAELQIENNELSTNYTSVHPAITGSAPVTQSFASDSNYSFIGGEVVYVTSSEFMYADQPAVGIKNRIKEKVRNEDIQLPFNGGNTLSSVSSIQQNYLTKDSGSYTKDINLLEIAASPQNEVNDDINNSFGYFNIGEYIGDPRQISESINHYPDLDNLRDTYFNKYYKNYNWADYVRLIKYFDNSLFKMIKDFAPAKSSLATGVVIKQHLLERNKQRPPITEVTQSYYSGSIQTGFATGSQGGVYDAINRISGSTELENGPSPDVVQTWYYETPTISGSLIVTQSTHDEFYNGELSGSEFVATNGELVLPFPSSSKLDAFEKEAINLNDNLAQYEQAWYANSFPFINFDKNIGKISYVGWPVGQVGVPAYFDEELDTYFRKLQPGDSLTVNIIEINSTFAYNSTGQIIDPASVVYPNAKSFTITTKRYVKDLVYDGAGYIFGVDHDWAPEGVWSLFAVNPQGTSGFFNASIVYDGGPIGAEVGEESYTYNNANNNRVSGIFQDIDYSSNLTTPVNFDLLQRNAALKAPIQDSNYAQRSWSNSRYRGTRVSSLDFNLKIQR
jgi:hypothetical protein